ncbi:histidine phosphatase family protein [Candidatus Woesearchaeota archaeon]|nr:histidine phosphatase family protein [Candidatus Woesearchaeota archaeon]
MAEKLIILLRHGRTSFPLHFKGQIDGAIRVDSTQRHNDFLIGYRPEGIEIFTDYQGIRSIRTITTMDLEYVLITLSQDYQLELGKESTLLYTLDPTEGKPQITKLFRDMQVERCLPSHVHASPSLRVRQSLEPGSGIFDWDLDSITYLDDLRERNFGNHQGHSLSELGYRDSQRMLVLDFLYSRDCWHPFTDSEKLENLTERLKRAWEQALASEGPVVLIAGHGLGNSYLWDLAHAQPFERYHAQPSGAVHSLIVNDNNGKVIKSRLTVAENFALQ